MGVTKRKCYILADASLIGIVADQNRTIATMFQGAITLIAALGLFTCPLAYSGELASFGQVQFQNSCQPSVQIHFERAVALLHSFEFGESEQEFRKVEREDPTCVIAAWGMALANTQRSGADIPVKDLAAGWKELEPWLSRPAKTEREQMYLMAVSKIYIDYEHASADVRGQRYAAAMEQIHRKYPDDINASLFYALTSIGGTGAEGIKNRRAALDILLPIFAAHPDNPGAAHYIIHAADTPELAILALPAARKYAAIAPDSPHALHMPSHIFNRLGYWQESIDSNIASARVAAEWVQEGRDGMFDELHALNNLEYGYLQLGQNEKARDVIDRIAQVVKAPGGDSWAPIDARIYYDVDTHDWQDALKTEPPAKSSFAENFDIYWIHAIAAARSGKPQEAALALENFRKSSNEWIKGHGFGDVLHIALMQAEAWTLFARGNHQEANKTLKEAIQFERDDPIYYADVLPRPSAEMLGDMLLEMNRPTEALKAYKVALEMAPNRLDSLRGAKIAATKSEQEKLAMQYARTIASEDGKAAPRP